MQSSSRADAVRKEFQNMTFEELNEFVDEWMVRTNDFVVQLCNQSASINQLFKNAVKHADDCLNIRQRLIQLHEFQNLADLNMSIILDNMQVLEQNVIWLENTMERLGKDVENLDAQRCQAYHYILKISDYLNDMQNIFNEWLQFYALTSDADQFDVEANVQCLVNLIGQHADLLRSIEARIQTARLNWKLNEEKLTTQHIKCIEMKRQINSRNK